MYTTSQNLIRLLIITKYLAKIILPVYKTTGIVTEVADCKN